MVAMNSKILYIFSIWIFRIAPDFYVVKFNVKHRKHSFISLHLYARCASVSNKKKTLRVVWNVSAIAPGPAQPPDIHSPNLNCEKENGNNFIWIMANWGLMVWVKECFYPRNSLPPPPSFSRSQSPFVVLAFVKIIETRANNSGELRHRNPKNTERKWKQKKKKERR